MNNKVLIVVILLIVILSFNVLTIFEIVPKNISNVIYILFSLIGLFTLLKMGAFSGVGKGIKQNFNERNKSLKKDNDSNSK